MIFSRFRNKKTWQHKDSNIRISAINNELDVSNPEHKAILFSLLSEDTNELVRRAVLLKINDFNTWLSASLDNNNKKVRGYAEKEIETILLTQHTITLSDDEKLTFIRSKPKSALLESWIKVEQSPDVIINLFKQIGKPQLALTIFKDKAIIEVQKFLIEQESSISGLEKLLKKSSITEISALISDKIAQIKELQEKPKKLSKQIQLLLSKLLALKDNSDYQNVIAKKATLEQEWQSVSSELSCLTDEEQNTFIAKYEDIENQLLKLFAPKAEAFEQQKIAERLTQEQNEQAVSYQQQISQLEQQISDAIFTNEQIDEALFENKTSELKAAITQSVLEQTIQDRFINSIEQLQIKLTKLPEIAQSITEATHLISKISQLPLPEHIEHLVERESNYQQWLSQWKNINATAAGVLPDSITNAYDEIVKQWQAALVPLHKQQKQNYHQIQRKLADFKRLVNIGKYNPAFGVFKKIQNLHSHLNSFQLNKIQRDYEFCQAKISELSDWEHYIATPRKQALLDQITMLVEQPLDNPSEQAAKVKEYRKKWNALGHAEDDLEKSYNEKFDEACEQAFAPCRLFYAEQEKIREQHLTIRLGIIAQAEQFAKTIEQADIDWKSVDGQLNQIKQKWRDAGEVERNKYRALNEQFNQALKPVKFAIQNQHQINIEAKKVLINKTEQLLNESEIEIAVNQVKEFQKQWRNIGYCGPKDENKLWQLFRQFNDKIFSRRDDEQSSIKAEQSQLQLNYENKLNQIEQVVGQDAAIDVLNRNLKDLQDLKDEVKDNQYPLKSILQKIDRLSEQFEQAKIQLKNAESKKVWVTVFEVLVDSVEKDIEQLNSFISLPSSWQRKLVQHVKTDCEPSLRLDKTIELEILAAVESPSQDKERRLTIQISLMQSRMAANKTFDIEAGFFQWLNLGKLTKSDLPLLARVKSLLVK